MKPLSILHIGKFYPPHPGGMEAHVRDLAERQTGIARVSVVAANDAMRNDIDDQDGVHVVRVGRLATLASMPVCPGLVSAIRQCPADLVHIHMPNPGAALAFLMSGHNGRVVVHHHADTLGRKLLRRLSDPFVKRLMRRADRVVATSFRYLNSSSELTLFHEKCRVVPLGIDPQRIRKAEPGATRQIQERFGTQFILSVGRLVPYKGFDILIRAMKDVDARLVLIGTGAQQSMLTRLITAEGMWDKVALLGHVDDLSPFFAAASVFAFPSVTRAEAFGIVQLEAMAAGLPVVNTNIDSAVPEVCIDGQTGITVPPNDPIALRGALQLLLERQDLRAQLGEAAKKRVNDEFTSDRMAARISSVYAEVLGAEYQDILTSAIRA